MLLLVALFCACSSDSSDEPDADAGAMTHGGSAGMGQAGGDAGSTLEPECMCAGECLAADDVATVYCDDSTTILRIPIGTDCKSQRYVVQGYDYGVYFMYSESGELVRTERSMAGAPRCESGQDVEPCPDPALLEAGHCVVCAGVDIGNPGGYPPCE